MNPLIDKLTQNLKPCSGCGKGLADPFYDVFWKKPEEKKKDEDNQTDPKTDNDGG